MGGGPTVRPLEYFLNSPKISRLFQGQGRLDIAGAEEIAFYIFRARPNFYHINITVDLVDQFLNRDDSPFDEFKAQPEGQRLSIIRRAKEAAETWKYRNLYPKVPPPEQPGIYNAIWGGGYTTHCQHCGKAIHTGEKVVLNIESIYPSICFHFCGHTCLEAMAGGHSVLFRNSLRETMKEITDGEKAEGGNGKMP